MWQIVGQSKVVSYFKKCLETGLLAHAYLFIGPHHVGKMQLAINVAQALNCQEDKPPCSECNSCQKIAQGKHVDVQVLSVDSNLEKNKSTNKAEIGIEKIRQIQRAANLPPFEGKYKLFIIDGADLLSLEAANCLLKTLEEPYNKVLFLLLAKTTKTVPPTVISRCQQLTLMPLAVDEAEKALIDLHGVQKQKARLLSTLSKGCIGWAISTLKDKKLLEHYYEDREVILDMIHADYEERFIYATRLADQYKRNREITQEVLKGWVEIWRDILLIKTGINKAITNIDIQKRLEQLSRDMNLCDIRYFINDILVTMINLRKNVNARLAIEAMMMNIPERAQVKGGS
ncbi:MAG: DNA polymerase III subunit delta' [Dehalococcoidia bacterium]|nr:MAG: DNA polymerase III subunit delta' [Dehalococcoidia bacterium]